MRAARKLTRKVIRQSVSLPPRLARHVRQVARARRMSTSQVVCHLVEQGINSQKREKEWFLSLADELVSVKDPKERERLKRELARMTFGR